MCQGSKVIIEYNTDHVYYVLLELKRGRNSLCLHFSVDNLSAGAYLLPQWQPVSLLIISVLLFPKRLLGRGIAGKLGCGILTI